MLPEQGKEFFPKLVASIFPGSFAASIVAVSRFPEKERSKIHKILDVAAGSGAWSLAFARAIPEARVTTVDFPEMTPITREFAEKFGVAARYDYVEGDLRQVDFGREMYDLVILGHIIHSEGEKHGKELLRKSYAALRPGGKLLIGEFVPNDARTGPAMPVLFGLTMLLQTEEGNVFTLTRIPYLAEGRRLRQSNDHSCAAALNCDLSYQVAPEKNPGSEDPGYNNPADGDCCSPPLQRRGLSTATAANLRVEFSRRFWSRGI